jgi:hypothetical protein
MKLSAQLLIAVLVVAVLVYLIMGSYGSKAKKTEDYAGDMITVYGTMGCGWTRKQLEALDAQGTKYTFVECSNGGCPADVDAYPTIKMADGTTKIGFTATV